MHFKVPKSNCFVKTYRLNSSFPRKGTHTVFNTLQLAALKLPWEPFSCNEVKSQRVSGSLGLIVSKSLTKTSVAFYSDPISLTEVKKTERGRSAIPRTEGGKGLNPKAIIAYRKDWEEIIKLYDWLLLNQRAQCLAEPPPCSRQCCVIVFLTH